MVPLCAVDNRSVDEILQFIEGDGKRDKKQKRQLTLVADVLPTTSTKPTELTQKPPTSNSQSSSASSSLSDGQDDLLSSDGDSGATTPDLSNSLEMPVPLSLRNSTNLVRSSEELIRRLEEVDLDDDEFWQQDELDPETRAKLDREVEEFRQKLEAQTQLSVRILRDFGLPF
jgi:hypothetical protein